MRAERVFFHQRQRSHQRAVIGDAATSDIERAAVADTREHEIRTDRHGRRVPPGNQLHGDVPLIVIHGYERIHVGSSEHDVGTGRTFDVETGSLERLNRRDGD